MKLISMTDYVLKLSTEYPKGKSLHNTDWSKEFEQFSKLVISYAEFLKQPLKLEMFVTCDNYGNVLFNPFASDKDAGSEKEFKQIQYNNAKEKVLFEGIEFRKNGGVNFLTINEDTFAFHDFNIKFKDLTVEFLVQYNLELTESAIKQIGL